MRADSSLIREKVRCCNQGGLDDAFAQFVRDRGDHHLRVAVLLTGDWHAGEDLVQVSLVKL
jgi:DNA-directed RNA polymerase specialized sigma24 family protein